MSRLYSPENTPGENLEILARNPYIGRILVEGFAGGVAVQAYGIEGRSDGSRNRVQVSQGGLVSTEVFETSKPVGDPELTIYDSMQQRGSVHIVSNGNQTSTAIQYLRCGKTFEEAMLSRLFEPDEPNFTPRISGYIDLYPTDQPRLNISVIRKDRSTGTAVHSFYPDYYPENNLESGVGYAVHTYKGNGDPLPSFDEEPFKIPIEDTAKGMAQLLWNNLDRENRVSVVGKVFTPTSREIYIINRHGEMNYARISSD